VRAEPVLRGIAEAPAVHGLLNRLREATVAVVCQLGRDLSRS
jgi:hypothetical protein